MQIKLSKQAIKVLDKMDKATVSRIIDAISGLSEVPPLGDVKPLKGYNERFRLRVGTYRVLFTIVDNEVHVSDIGSRGDIYK